MKKTLVYLLLSLMVSSLFVACKGETPQSADEKSAAHQQVAPAGKSGKVVETMNTKGYTYVQVDTGTEKIWAAAPEFKVAVGDSVVVPDGMAMPNYESPSLKRTFELIYFVDSIMVGGVMPEPTGDGGPGGHPQLSVSPGGEQGVDLSGIAKPENGKTVAEIYNEKSELSGKEVIVRGKVVKFNPQIMGTNWLHIQDGTGDASTSDLTVTSSQTVNIGDTVLVTGKLTADKDLGQGYNFAVIIENADVVIE